MIRLVLGLCPTRLEIFFELINLNQSVLATDQFPIAISYAKTHIPDDLFFYKGVAPLVLYLKI